jgi:serine/threonine protein kinase
LAPGLVIVNRFRLIRQLGEGGMGCVWRASHLTLGIDVAVKFIDTSLLKFGEIRSRFAQEAMAAARIRSPHVVSILDYGTDTTGRPYIAMELLEGEDLAHRLERERTLSVAQTAQVITQACRGLSKAHAGGIIHRDMKPENLFLCEEEEGFLLKILDFGVAKAQLTADVGHQTALGAVIGTPAYMSPEQARGDKVDFRCDLYSLASVAYHALVGEPPFPADNLHSLLVGLIARMPTPVSIRKPELTTKFDPWFAKALAKLPNDRFQNAREMAETFLALCSSVGPAPEEWSFTGSDIRAVRQILASVPPLDETLQSREDNQNNVEARAPSVPVAADVQAAADQAPPIETLQGLGAEDSSQGPPVHAPGADTADVTSGEAEDDEDDDTEVGGFFSAAMEDRLRMEPSIGEPPVSRREDLLVGAGTSSTEPEVVVDVQEPREPQESGSPVARPQSKNWKWSTVVMLVAIVVLGSVATYGLAWLFRG